MKGILRLTKIMYTKANGEEMVSYSLFRFLE